MSYKCVAQENVHYSYIAFLSEKEKSSRNRAHTIIILQL